MILAIAVPFGNDAAECRLECRWENEIEYRSTLRPCGG
jgi:hypothetical protein